MKETFTLTTHFPDSKCKVYMGVDLLEDASIQSVVNSLGKLVVVTTEALKPLIPAPFAAHLIVLPNGESIKSRQWKENLENELYQRECGKNTSLLAIGGGTLLDLTGFVAATYCRGIAFISMPTTLLAMTDAAIGGKTGINLEEGKNYLGSYYFPEMILIDFRFLDSLPIEELKWGLSETIKHGLINSTALYEKVESNLNDLLQKKNPLLQEVIETSLHCKQAIIQQDPLEKTSIRHLLNFGHTVGHALESVSNYQLPHGHAVGIGMGVEIRLSELGGDLDPATADRILALLHKLYDFTPLRNLDVDALVKAMKRDKKNSLEEIKFVSLEAIGKAKLATLQQGRLKDALRMC